MHDVSSEAFLAVTLHASEFPARQRESLLEGLRAGRLPGRLLYLSPAQAQRWLDYHAAWSPSRTDKGLHALYGQAYQAAAAQLAEGGTPSGARHLVGVGCGGGTKDAQLLAALEATRDGGDGTALHYSALDASAALVAEATLQAQRTLPAVRVHPLVLDLTAAPPLGAWLEAQVPDAPRVLSCFGMLPNLDAVAFPAWLASQVRPEDVLLISANLSPQSLTEDGPRILAQYDNPLARAWYAGVLSELGMARSAYVITVEARPLESGTAGEGAWQVAVTAVMREDTNLTLYDETLELAIGRRLAVFHSQRFTRSSARGLLERAGLAVLQDWVGAGGEEGIFLCRRR